MTDPKHPFESADHGLLDENLEDLYENAPCGYISVGLGGHIGKVNRTLLTWTGYAQEELLTIKRFQDLLTPGAKIFYETHYAPLLLMQGFINEISLDFRCKDGGTIPVLVNSTVKRGEDGTPRMVRISVFNISERRQYERQLLLARKKAEHHANYDVLTALPNRVLLHDRIEHALSLSARRKTGTALLFIDLDRFKQINDTLGHSIGDQLLIQVAGRLETSVRDTDTVSRQGGDEFVVLLSEIVNSAGAAKVASEVLFTLAEPFVIGEHHLHLSGSIGISLFPEDGADADTLMKHADAAMYHAKSLGRNNYQFFASHINEHAMKHAAIEHLLRKAMASDNAVLFYQPKINIANDTLIGAEALIRLRKGENELILPASFISIAEESGLIIQLGEWVLREACRQNRHWQELGHKRIPIAVNVSAVQFRDKNFVSMLSRILEETGLDPRCLELELTESITMHDLEATSMTLAAISEMGVSLSIDDFGTGYSSLSYLRRFPIDTLKIDQSFVRDIATDSDDGAIICAIIDMAKNLKHKVIAEGVETSEQLEFLRQHGCDEIQGFYFSEPLSPSVFEQEIFQGKKLEKWAGRQAEFNPASVHFRHSAS